MPSWRVQAVLRSRFRLPRRELPGNSFFLFLDGSLFGREIHRHALTFEHGHGFYLAIVLEIIGETQEEHFTLFLEEDASSTEEDISLDFVAFAKEAFGVLELEVVIVVVGLRTEANLFDFHLHLFGFQLLLSLLLLVEEFRVVDQSTNGRLRIGADLDRDRLLFVARVEEHRG